MMCTSQMKNRHDNDGYLSCNRGMRNILKYQERNSTTQKYKKNYTVVYTSVSQTL